MRLGRQVTDRGAEGREGHPGESAEVPGEVCLIGEAAPHRIPNQRHGRLVAESRHRARWKRASRISSSGAAVPSRLHSTPPPTILRRSPEWRNGRRSGLKIRRGQPRASSTLASGTRRQDNNLDGPPNHGVARLAYCWSCRACRGGTAAGSGRGPPSSPDASSGRAPGSRRSIRPPTRRRPASAACSLAASHFSLVFAARPTPLSVRDGT